MRPTSAGRFGIPVERVIQVGEFDVPVVRDGLQCVPYFSRPEGEPPGDHENVTEVAPSGASRATLQCSRYFLGERPSAELGSHSAQPVPQEALFGFAGRIRGTASGRVAALVATGLLPGLAGYFSFAGNLTAYLVFLLGSWLVAVLVWPVAITSWKGRVRRTHQA